MAQICTQRWKKGFSRLEAADAGVYAAVLGLIYEQNGPISRDFDAIASCLQGLSAEDAEKSINVLCEKRFLFVTPKRQLMDWTAAEKINWLP